MEAGRDSGGWHFILGQPQTLWISASVGPGHRV